MTSLRNDPPPHGETGRDPRTGKFLPNNTFAKSRRRTMVEVPPIPDFLTDHAGVRALWPMWTQLVAQGNGAALKTMTDLALGLVRPKYFEETDFGEEYDEDFE